MVSPETLRQSGAQDSTAAVGLSLWSTAEMARGADFPMASPSGGDGRAQRSRSSLVASPATGELCRTSSALSCQRHRALSGFGSPLPPSCGTGWSAALSLAPGGDKAQATAAEET